MKKPSNPDTWPENITVLLVDTNLGMEMHAYFTRDLDDCINRVRRGDTILATAIVPIPWKPYE